MESASFIGMFGIKNSRMFADMSEHASGICYAWKLGQDGHIVLPLNAQHIPTGNCYILGSEEFEAAVRPLDVGQTPGLAPSSTIMRSDAPDLLGIWYEQAVATGTTPATVIMQQPKQAGEHNEPQFTTAWNPDEPFEDGSSKGAASGVAAGAADGAAPGATTPSAAAKQYRQAQEASAPDDSALTIVVPADYTPAQQPQKRAAAPSSPSGERQQRPQAEATPSFEARQDGSSPETPEERAAKVEEFMRTRFAELSDALDDVPNTELETEIAKLLGFGSSFTWKQKFMFTEFGLTLRRKRRSALALMSHMRALSLAPKDEHVLFNVARSEYEMGNIPNAKIYLDRALEAAPEFTVAKNFRAFLTGNS